MQESTESELGSGGRWDWWDQVREEDIEGLTGPVDQGAPCPWCKRRRSHSELCKGQEKEWSRMPWGKHKGRSTQDIPTDYLEFMINKGNGSVEIRTMMLRELQRRSSKYNSPEWEDKANSTQWD